jgi:hypothetical protein
MASTTNPCKMKLNCKLMLGAYRCLIQFFHGHTKKIVTCYTYQDGQW